MNAGSSSTATSTASFVKHLPAKTVAHFFQLNNFLNRVIELEVTAALPEVK